MCVEGWGVLRERAADVETMRGREREREREECILIKKTNAFNFIVLFAYIFVFDVFNKNSSTSHMWDEFQKALNNLPLKIWVVFKWRKLIFCLLLPHLVQWWLFWIAFLYFIHQNTHYKLQSFTFMLSS